MGIVARYFASGHSRNRRRSTRNKTATLTGPKITTAGEEKRKRSSRSRNRNKKRRMSELVENAALPTGATLTVIAAPAPSAASEEHLVAGGGALSAVESSEEKLVMGGVDTAPLSVGNVIKMRGLPWETTVEDVVRFLAPSRAVTEKDIYLVMGPNGRCSGEAYVELASPEELDKVIADLDGKLMGRRWIEIFKSTKSEMEKGSRDTADRLMAGRSAVAAYGSPAPTGGVVRLRGLPWGATEYDIIQFFSEGGFSIDGSQIAMPLVRGRASGEAYIDFGSASRAEEAKRIMNRRCIGSRYIEIFFANPRDFVDALRAMDPGAVGPIRGAALAPLAGGLLPGAAMPARRYEMEGPYGAAAAGPMMSPMYPPYPATLQPSGSMAAFGRETSSVPASGPTWGSSSSASLTSPSLPPSVASAAPAAAAAAAAVVANTVTPSMGYEADYRYGQATALPPIVDGGFSVLRMRGLPFNATANSIVTFFEGYSMSTILPTTVPVDGRPSGEAYVEFRSSTEAARALRMRQKARMDHRYIELFPSTKEEMEMAANGWDSREIRARMGRAGASAPAAP